MYTITEEAITLHELAFWLRKAFVVCPYHAAPIDETPSWACWYVHPNGSGATFTMSDLVVSAASKRNMTYVAYAASNTTGILMSFRYEADESSRFGTVLETRDHETCESHPQCMLVVQLSNHTIRSPRHAL